MSELKYYIYGYKDPTTMKYFYIGKGSNGRYKVHLQKAINNKITNHNRHLYHKICLLIGIGTPPIIDILYRTDDEKKVYEMEKLFIEDIGFENLCNLDHGGKGGLKMTEEQKNKISKKAKGRKLSPAHRDKVILNLTYRGVTEESIIKIKATKKEYFKNHRGNRLGCKLSDATRLKMSISRKGKPSKIKGSDNSHSKKVFQYDLNNKLIKIWDSLGEVCSENNYSKGSLCRAIDRPLYTAYGYKWAYGVIKCAA